MSADKRIAVLEQELAQLRKMARTRRQPIVGFGGVVQRLREAQGMGVRDLAEAAGLSSPGIISRLEQDPDANPCWKTIQLIAVGLGMSATELVRHAEHPTP